MSGWSRYFPWIVVGLGALYLGGTMAPRSDPEAGMKITAFASLPVLDGGRVKPIDTFARINLMSMSRRQTYVDENDTRQPAVRWLLNIMAEGLSDYYNVVLIADPQVQDWLGLQQRPRGLYALREVAEKARTKGDQLKKLMNDAQSQKDLGPVEKKVLLVFMRATEQAKLVRTMQEGEKKRGAPEKAAVFRIDFDQLLAMLKLEPREGFRYSLTEITANRDRFAAFQEKAKQARERDEKQRDVVDVRTLELFGHLQTHFGLAQLGGVAMVPSRTDSLDDWKTMGRALAEGDAHDNPNAQTLENILRAYALGDAKEFNKEVAAHALAMTKRMPGEMKTAKLEVWFNEFAPFYQCANLYVLAFVLAVLSWVIWREPLRLAAFRLGILVVVVHTLALLLRMYIQWRPPVTNLYSSAVFIGWGCVLLCLVLEAIYRNGVNMAVAAMLGFATMIIAHHLGGSGDTMEMMQAVLDTNFWLATHVTTVTLGYTATFVAGFLGMVFVFLMLATTVRHFYDTQAPLYGREKAYFLLSVVGLVTLPATALVAMIYGLWILWVGEQITGWIGLTLAAPVIVGALVCMGVLIFRRSSPGVELPGLVSVCQQVSLTSETSKTLATAIYGTVCFATLLSFVGTVLGGIWADQSWGRFWGWDPKENGALLIVVMNALILHARWGGMIRERGLATLAIVGNMVTAWSWFGTNQLGVGLHAYGFNNTLALGCRWFWVSQLVILGLGLIPLRYWRAYAATEPAAKAKTKGAPRNAGARTPVKPEATGIVPAH